MGKMQMKKNNTARVTVYMTHEQLEKITEKARSMGMDLSTYMRFLALKDLAESQEV